MRSPHHPLVTLAALAALALAACDAYPTPPDARLPPGPPWGIVRFAFREYPGDTLSVIVTHGPTLEAARAYVRTGRGPRIPIGPIVRGAGIDGRYPFHFLPDQLRLVERVLEPCDAAFMYTEMDVEEFFREAAGAAEASHALWCPASAYPVAVY